MSQRHTVIALGLLLAQAAAAAPPTCPVDDPFYDYIGEKNLTELACNQRVAVGLFPSDDDGYDQQCVSTTYPGPDRSLVFDPYVGARSWVRALWSEKKADVDLFVLSGDNCGAGASCVDSSTTAAFPAGGPGGTATEAVEWISDGGGYWINLDEIKDDAKNGYAVTLVTGCSDVCETSDVREQIYCSTETVSSTVGGSSVLDAYACGTPYSHLSQPNPESIYLFEPQATGSVTFVLDGMTKDHDLYVLEDACDPFTCIASSTAAMTGTDKVTFDARLGHTYYIVVEAFDGTGDYTLSFEDNTGGCNEHCSDGKDNDLDGLIDCADVDDCATDPACACDIDGDGHDAKGGACGGDDCDDTDPKNYPGNTEVCDGQDNDCDGQIDEGLLKTWYRDADGDGYGLTSNTKTGCTAPAGYVAKSGDCDDTKASVNPGAAESCNGIDDDCDGQIDEGVVARDWYTDADGDGYGTGTPVSDCKSPGTGYVDAGGDCDDTKAAVNPGATEVCNGVDDDCNGKIDDGISFVDYWVDADGDGYGKGSPQSLCAPPSWASASRGGDCDDTKKAVNPGATEICNGIDDDCDGVIDDGIPTSDWYYDADGDGYGAGAKKTACSSPGTGWVKAGGDCDDTKKAVNPGATEVCNGIDDDCDGAIDEGLTFKDWYRDADADGYGAGSATNACKPPPGGYVDQAGDCNDGNKAIHPGATEVCNGIDDDCDGVIDDGIPTTTWYRDLDGDGYGGSVTRDLCAQPSGYVVAGGDCDDTNAKINPDALEICNGVDDDCDGLVDNDDPDLDPSALGIWYADTDGDGYGDPSVSEDSCDPIPGSVLNDGDCDDTDAAINPAADEICDGIDNDCDGRIDDADPSVDLSTAGLWYADTDGDGFGDAGNTASGCGAPAGYVSDDTDCDDKTADRHPGLAELCDGMDNDCDYVVDEGTECFDDDGDGYTELGGDCDDGDPTIHPGAIEVCDGVDQDCDGTVDEHTECYDDDGDGYSENDGDCNDGDRSVNPGAPEIDGDGIDNDCDGSVDGGAYDPDGDGYTELGGDCDPDDPDTYPGAPEIPDWKDNDCDGLIDEGTAAVDDDGDGYCEGFDFDGDGTLSCSDLLLPGDCNDADPDIHPHNDDVPDGVDNDCDGVIDEGSDLTDDDGDGFSEQQGDCDDTNPDIWPGAEEIEDGVDNDCDGLVDEGFVDRDGDGVSEADGDCDDDNGWASPNVEEMCDGFDNDCDGVIDEGCDLGPDTDEIVEPPGACGCSAPGTSGGLPWLAAVLLVFGRRLRRVEGACAR